jgi:hypothetical protein
MIEPADHNLGRTAPRRTPESGRPWRLIRGLSASLRRLATLGIPGIGVVQALRQVTEACVDLFSVMGSGIMLGDEQNVPRYVAASDGPGRMLDVVESDTGQGPSTVAVEVVNRLPARFSRRPRAASSFRSALSRTASR